MTATAVSRKKPHPRQLHLTSNEIEVKGGTPQDFEALAMLVDALSKKSLRLLDAKGNRATLHILQNHAPLPDGFHLTFTPGILEAVTGGTEWDHLELLRFIESRGF
jgi:hypothetical protein